MKDENKKENPVLLLLKWAEKDRGFLIASVICAFLGGLLAIGPYIGIYRLMDAFLTDTCSIQIISENAVLITATVIIRQVFQGLSGIFSHKGAYGALFRVRCMITEHLSKVPLGALDERRTGDIKTVLNEDIEKLELCLAHNIPELVGFATGPVVIFIYLMTINVPLAMNLFNTSWYYTYYHGWLLCFYGRNDAPCYGGNGELQFCNHRIYQRHEID